MSITDVRVYLRSREDKLKAFVSVTLDAAFAVKDLKVVDGSKGLFVSYPSRKKADGTYRDLAHPITRELREEIQTQVLDAYQKALDGHAR